MYRCYFNNSRDPVQRTFSFGVIGDSDHRDNTTTNISSKPPMAGIILFGIHLRKKVENLSFPIAFFCRLAVLLPVLQFAKLLPASPLAVSWASIVFGLVLHVNLYSSHSCPVFAHDRGVVCMRCSLYVHEFRLFNVY